LLPCLTKILFNSDSLKAKSQTLSLLSSSVVMKSFLSLLLLFLTFSKLYPQIKVNEIMYAPLGQEKEWFEIYNAGFSQVNLNQWFWQSSSTSGGTHIITRKNIFLYSNIYVVVCEDSLNFRQYHPGVSGILLQSEGWSNLNNTGSDKIMLFNYQSQLKDSAVYFTIWGGSNGYSLERINALDSSHLQRNWASSIDPLKSTPDRINSITPKNFELILKSFDINPAYPVEGDTLKLSVVIKNIGLFADTNFTFRLYKDLNFDSIPTPDEQLSMQNYYILNSNDSIVYNYSYPRADSNYMQFIAKIEFPPDEDTLNNIVVKRIFIANSNCMGKIVVNEIMYAPVSPEKEWFEIYNYGNSPVNIAHWNWKDAVNSPKVIVQNNFYINSKSYAVICEDSVNFKLYHPTVTGIILQSYGWNTLNNSGYENIILYYYTRRIDSVLYSNTYGGENGYSLEKINPSGSSVLNTNWGTCINPLKSTPDRINSITPKNYDLQLKSFSILPYNPKTGDTLKFYMTVKNIGLFPDTNFSLKLFRDYNLDSIPNANELISSQNYNILSPNDSVQFYYYIANIDSGYKQYIATVNFQSDEDTLNNKSVKSVIVGNPSVSTGILINEIMYAPANPEPEWIELYNNTNTIINIKNWKISDSSTSYSPITITSSDYFFQPNSYLVIAKNNYILSAHKNIDSTKIIYLSALPSLNNTGDIVSIYNSSDELIDRVAYDPEWGGNSVNSLERISFTSQSNDPSNWKTSVDCEFSSPTRQNSVCGLSQNSFNDLVINEIMYDPRTNEPDWVEIYNPTTKNLNLNGWKLNESNVNHSLTDSCNFVAKPGDFIIIAADTSIYSGYTYLRTPTINQKVIIRNNLSLSNSGEPVKILDIFDKTIDSVYYSSGWHNPNLSTTKGISLERLNPLGNSNDKNNWYSCTNSLGGTPGLKNSISLQNTNKLFGISVSPNPFSPDGDGYNDITTISYKLSSNVAQVNIKIFDVKGRLVRNLLNNQSSGQEGSVIFNGYNNSGEKLRLGIYIILLEAVDSKGGTVETLKSTVVIATKL